MTEYRPRIVDGELDELLGALPAILLEGPKGVGKTATAEQRVASIVRMDDPAQREIAAADPSLLLQRERPILLDEWQLVPAVWDAVRRAVDDDNSPNQYLLTGSAMSGGYATHSGAARIVSIRMRPLSLAERGPESPTVSICDLLTGKKTSLHGETRVTLADYTHEILASGFPGFRHLQGRALRAQLDGYVARIVDRDFEEQGHRVRRPQTLQRWFKAYAAATSTTATFEKIRDAATGGQDDKPTKVTSGAYREVLERLWIVEPVPAWLPTRNHISALMRAPKHQLADPALAARLLGMDADALLRGESGKPATALRDGSLLGKLFESLVTLSVRIYAQAAESTVKHLRTQGGRQEVDLIVVRGDQKVVAIEVKLSATVNDDDVKHLLWLREKIGEDLLDAIVVTTGQQAYRRKDGIGVVPAALLGI